MVHVNNIEKSIIIMGGFAEKQMARAIFVSNLQFFSGKFLGPLNNYLMFSEE